MFISFLNIIKKTIYIIFIFAFIILKVSSRENIEELNNSLDNINNIDVLRDSNNR